MERAGGSTSARSRFTAKRFPAPKEPSTNSARPVIACLGASITAAKGSFDWIGELAARSRNARFEFRNFGVGGDLAYSALQRLPQVIAARPAAVVVLVGGDDVLSAASHKLLRFLTAWKRLPRGPTHDWYRENLAAIARRLREASIRVALCSLCPVGEDPSSKDPLQARVNRLIEEYSVIVKEVAHDEGAAYVPVYERMWSEIAATPGRAFTRFRFFPLYANAFRQFVLGESLDRIGERNGWRFHTDGIHLNSHGGMLVADAVQGFLDELV